MIMSVVSVEKNEATKMKQKLMNKDPVKEETKSFLNFSRENLNISQVDLEQGFNRSRLRPCRNTIMSSIALLIAVLCLSLEGWKLQCSLTNTSEIEQLKRDFATLQHRCLQQNLMNELKLLEQQLYGKMLIGDNDSSETDIDDIDYDSNYDDDDVDDSASHDYSTDYQSTPKSSNLSEKVSISTPTSEFNKATEISVIRKAQTEGQEESEKNDDHVKEEDKAQFNQKKIDNSSNTKYKREVIATDTAISDKKNSKAKRYQNEFGIEESLVTMLGAHYVGQQAKASKIDSNARESAADNDSEENPISHMNEEMETDSDGITDEQDTHLDVAENKTNHHKHSQNSKKNLKKLGRKLTRRNLRTPRQVRAVHYGADSTLFSVNDEYYGNGKARHSSNVFKAWRASDWVTDLNMDRFFSLADGILTVQESGLYLVYAQIHYLDEHDENGFHLLVNDRPVLQCMVFSPGMGHKSRSCFSAQALVLQSGDQLVLKDVGAARYTLFQHDKSFFGLVKLGEARHQKHLTPQALH